MRNEIDGISLFLIEQHLELEQRVIESRKNFYKLIRRLAKQGVPYKILAQHCQLTPQRISEIIHIKS